MITGCGGKNSDNEELISSIIKKYNSCGTFEVIKNKSLDIQIDQNQYKLTRLRDDKFQLLCENAVAISDDHFHMMDLCSDNELISYSLSRTYFCLKSLFGASGRFYDEWKSSFSYPFLIQFEKNSLEYDYVMRVGDVKGNVCYSIAKLVAGLGDDKKKSISEPLEEFSREEIRIFANYFFGYLSGYFETVEPSNCDFIKTVWTENIIYGWKGAFFDTRFPDEDRFFEMIAKLKQSVEPRV